MQMHMFHFTMARLEPGSIIAPGNWGRLIGRYTLPDQTGQSFGNGWKLAQELIFEAAREAAPEPKPSRLSSCFALHSIDDANAYRQMNDRWLQQVLHVVEVTDQNALTHMGGIGWLNFPQPGQPFKSLTTLHALEYWKGTPNGITETITASPLRVVDCLD